MILTDYLALRRVAFLVYNGATPVRQPNVNRWSPTLRLSRDASMTVRSASQGLDGKVAIAACRTAAARAGLLLGELLLLTGP
ncbi:hypothetical protein JQ557_29670 [Bradyrhizobium sp. U87765 SZCCT0131]|uniref:hypothetical protein n=1 Tax=unclassified Bradyrhizobium TaxID=2631580 RepID=UPI001BA5BE6B|nr:MULTISPECIES: hypothetical protein [unclassified Bradyrhizobium]MBR1222203.1 hypothetical protein [Bradyrhizobium sp. U87765 SZCCT0131]MBR1264313.1 hypothetical protein [Bradyrhizobium sp. U87765 SZCCT0134]MBR1307904.1 hypothetical protein [Bradyrhizobium sp. U87765 SZCCT0110]MBR1320563.1 hypothetical protein [Bradyrhizobium sp. U87765 SZCCT0109]MBR1348324.1 hypothetical protein [Bradyrhizobium sp. U87765 SZCCT0048]